MPDCVSTLLLGDEGVRGTHSPGPETCFEFQESKVLRAEEVGMAVRRLIYVLGMSLLLMTVGARTSVADCGYSQALRAHLTRIRGMLVAIVAAMPEDRYDFRPTKDVRSFREMVEHLITDSYTHAGFVMGKTRAESEKIAEEKNKGMKTREEYLKALGEAFNFADKMFAGITDENAKDTVTAMRGAKATRVEAALQAFEDDMDHYGNFVVYLRLNGIVPPDTAENLKRLKGQPDHDHH
jgi:uncharacterized damage-inducible protein DinB